MVTTTATPATPLHGRGSELVIDSTFAARLTATPKNPTLRHHARQAFSRQAS